MLLLSHTRTLHRLVDEQRLLLPSLTLLSLVYLLSSTKLFSFCWETERLRSKESRRESRAVAVELQLKTQYSLVTLLFSNPRGFSKMCFTSLWYSNRIIILPLIWHHHCRYYLYRHDINLIVIVSFQTVDWHCCSCSVWTNKNLEKIVFHAKEHHRLKTSKQHSIWFCCSHLFFEYHNTTVVVFCITRTKVSHTSEVFSSSLGVVFYFAIIRSFEGCVSFFAMVFIFSL